MNVKPRLSFRIINIDNYIGLLYLAKIQKKRNKRFFYFLSVVKKKRNFYFCDYFF